MSMGPECATTRNLRLPTGQLMNSVGLLVDESHATLNDLTWDALTEPEQAAWRALAVANEIPLPSGMQVEGTT